MFFTTKTISFLKKIAVKLKSKKANEFINLLVVKELELRFASIIKIYKNRASEEINFEDSKLIWFCWLQGIENAPELVKICYNSLLDNKPDGFEVNVITENNYKDYINFPPYILGKLNNGTISKTHFSDILRFALLAEYGGLWIDSSVLILKKMSSAFFDNNIFTLKSNVFDPYTSISKSFWTGYFIGFPKNTPETSFVRDCFYQYWKEEQRLFDYYFIDYLLLLTYKNIKPFTTKIDNLKSYGNNRMLMKNLLNIPINPDDDERLDQDKMKIYKLNNKMKKELQDKSGKPTYYSKIINKGFDVKVNC